MSDAETKICSICGQEKPISWFYLVGARRRPECKECKNKHYRKPKKQEEPVGRRINALWEWTPPPEILKPRYWRKYD